MSQTGPSPNSPQTDDSIQRYASLSRIISFIVLVVVILLVGVVAFQVIAGFLLPLFLAALLVVIFRPVHRWILKKCEGRQRLAAATTTAAVLLVVLVPLGWIVTLAITEGTEFVAKSSSQNGEWVNKIEAIRTKVKLDLPFSPQLQAIDESLQDLKAGEKNPQTSAARHQMMQHVRHLQKSLDDLNRELQSVQAEAPAPEEEETVTDRQRAAGALAMLAQLTQNAQDLEKHFSETDETSGDYLELLQSCELSYRSLRQRLAGGPVLAWAQTLANPSANTIEKWRAQATKFIQKWLLSVTGHTTALVVRFLLGLCIMVIATYYFMADGPAMIRTTMRLSPLEDKYEVELLGEFDRVSRAVVLATLLSAIVQGFLAGVGYYFAGLHSVFLLMVLTAAFAMIPFVGAAAVWVPACLYLALIEEQLGRAGALAVYGMLFISMADNVIKPMVLHGQSNLHPLLALLSVLGGVQAMGPIGILVGPMVMAFLQALLNILQAEISDLDNEPVPARAAAGRVGPIRGILTRRRRPAPEHSQPNPTGGDAPTSSDKEGDDAPRQDA